MIHNDDNREPPLAWVAYLVNLLGVSGDFAAHALRESKLSMAGSIRFLAPSYPLQFPDWYYGGPYLRVSEPDRDLPRRVLGFKVEDSVRNRVEMAAKTGEKLVPPFRDANSIDDALGELDSCLGYPKLWEEAEIWQYPTIQGIVATSFDRLREKFERAERDPPCRVPERLGTPPASVRRLFRASIRDRAAPHRKGGRTNRVRATGKEEKVSNFSGAN